MFIGSAKELCPELVIIPYEFEAYDACSKDLYQTLLGTADFVQSVSCDEAFIDVTYHVQQRLLQKLQVLSVKDLVRATEEDRSFFESFERTAMDVANHIREVVYNATQCHASVGIASNILLARVATQKAKPNGVYSLLQHDRAVHHVRELAIRDLPGVGHSTAEKCAQLHLLTCGDVQAASSSSSSSSAPGREGGGNNGMLSRMQSELGEKTGETVFNFCWGLDNRELENKARQTVGSDINWGIRFANQAQVDKFLWEFCAEVFSRLRGAQQTARHVTVDVKKRDYEGEPGKFLGCGRCIDFSRSVVPGRAVTSTEALYKCVAMLYKEIGVQPLDARGIGIHLKKLQPTAQAGLIGQMIAAGKSSGRRSTREERNDGPEGSSEESGAGATSETGRFLHEQQLHQDQPQEEWEQWPEEEEETSSHHPASSSSSTSSCSRSLQQQMQHHSRAAPADIASFFRTAAPAGKLSSSVSSADGVGRDGVEGATSVREAGGRDSLVVAPTRPVVECSVRQTEAGEEDTCDDAPPSYTFRDTAADAQEPSGCTECALTAAALAGSCAAPQSMGDVDLDVFMALPAEIQDELRRALGGGERAQAGVGASTAPASTTSVRSGPNAPPQVSKRKHDALSTGGKSGKSGSGHTQGKQLGILDMWKRSK
jgi:nucleotidyltransferase/DNA polymerase involved in DNA repair